MAIDIFKSAAKNEKISKKNVDNGQPAYTVHGKEFYDKMAEAHKLSLLFESTKQQYEALQSELKDEALSIFAESYVDGKNNPGSITIESDEIKGKFYSFMYTPQDAYKKIDKAVYTNLVSIYGADIAETETIYSINNSILSKHKSKITKAIKEIQDMSDEDKANLLIATPVYKVKKGSIDKLMTFCKGKNVKDKLVKLITDIAPTMLFKNFKETPDKVGATMTLKRSKK